MFSSMTRGKEVAYITQLLSIFGIAEVRQMRQLFSHLPDAKYGKIMARLHQEGIIYHDPSGKYLSTSRYAIDKARVPDSIRTFWAFIKIKDKVKSFCSGGYPAMLTFTTDKVEYDMIPVNAENMEAVMTSASEIPENVRRLLIVPSMRTIETMNFRVKNDYVMVVEETGEIELYRM